MSTASGRIICKPSVKALRKRLSRRVDDHPDKARAIRAVGILLPGPDRQDVEYRPVRALDPIELKRTDPSAASDPGLLLLLRWRCGLRGGCCACRRIRRRIGQELADNLRHLGRGYEIVMTGARHDRQPRFRQLRVPP